MKLVLWICFMVIVIQGLVLLDQLATGHLELGIGSFSTARANPNCKLMRTVGTEFDVGSAWIAWPVFYRRQQANFTVCEQDNIRLTYAWYTTTGNWVAVAKVAAWDMFGEQP